MQGNQALTSIEGKLGVPSTCGRKYGFLSSFHRRDRPTFEVRGGKSEFLSSRSWGISPHLEMRWGTWSSSQVVSGNSGFHSSYNEYLEEPHAFHKGIPASFLVSRGNSELLLKC